jgi:fibronectin type 3 domain-containing protein
MKTTFLAGLAALLLVFAQTSCDLGGGTEGEATVPTGLSARAQSTSTIYLSWTGITNADKYTVYRVSDTGNQQFEVFNAYDYTDTGLAPDTLYSYQVSATRGGVEGAKSSTVSQKTFPAGTIPVPGQVTGIGAAVAGNEVTLSWGAEGSASSYTLERGTGSSGPWTEVYSGSSTSYTDSGLDAGTYYYHAAASNASGMGPWSVSRVVVISGGPDPGPGTDPGTNPPSGIPGYLTVVTTTKNSVTLSWEAVEGAAGYKVYRSDSEIGTYTETSAGTFSGTGFTNTGLTANKDYWYKAAAYNSGGAGPKSIVPVKATTLANIGTIPGEYTTLAQKLAFIGTQFDNGTVYDITIDADESLTTTTVMTSGKNVTINLHSPSAEDIKTIYISGTGNLFLVSNSITLKLENIKLLGTDGNNASLVKVTSGGTLILNTGSEIKGNKLNNNRGALFLWKAVEQ